MQLHKTLDSKHYGKHHATPARTQSHSRKPHFNYCSTRILNKYKVNIESRKRIWERRHLFNQGGVRRAYTYQVSVRKGRATDFMGRRSSNFFLEVIKALYKMDTPQEIIDTSRPYLFLKWSKNCCRVMSPSSTSILNNLFVSEMAQALCSTTK